MQDFIENRWADVKMVLGQSDSSFVHTIEAYKTLENKLKLPSPPKSKATLPDKWRKVIESAVDVTLAIRDLERCVELTGMSSPETVHWFMETFIEKAYNLLDRTKTLTANVCGAYGLGGLRGKYKKQIDSKKVQGWISDHRHPRVHGRGGAGTLIERTIAGEPKLDWETIIVIGPDIIPQMIPEFDKSRLTPEKWQEVLSNHTRTLLGNLGQVLSDLESDIERYVKCDENWRAKVSLN